jgi:6-phosphogluconolactonase
VSGSRLVVLPDPAALATHVATELLGLLRLRQADGRAPHVALTGGTIAAAIHRETARLAPDAGVDWSRVDWWWGDERFVTPESPERNARGARDTFLDVVGAPRGRVHEMPSPLDALDVHTGAASYSRQLLRDWPGEFDLVMLGLGPDGHVASLFPGFPQLRADHTLAVGVTGSPKPPPERISLTLPMLNRAGRVWFVASGAEKAAAVQRSRTESDDLADPDADERLPAARVHGRDTTVWFVDRAAATPAG